MKKLVVLVLFAIICVTSSYGYFFNKQDWGPNSTYSKGIELQESSVDYYFLVGRWGSVSSTSNPVYAQAYYWPYNSDSYHIKRVEAKYRYTSDNESGTMNAYPYIAYILLSAKAPLQSDYWYLSIWW